MSTSDRHSGTNSAGSITDDLAHAIDLTGAAAAAAAGMPDPSVLARLANEFFAASGLGQQGVDVAGYRGAIPGDVLVPAQTTTNAAPTTARSYAPSVAPLAATASKSTTTNLNTGVSPTAAADVSQLPLAPEFAFLRDVRSIEALTGSTIAETTQSIPTASVGEAAPTEAHTRSFAAGTPAFPGVQAIPAAPMPTGTSSPTEAQFAALANSPLAATNAFPSAPNTPNNFASLSSVPASPTIAGFAPGLGSASGLSEASLVPGFGFLQDTRSLEAAGQNAIGQMTAAAASPTLPSESQLRSLASQSPAVPGVQAIPPALSFSSVGGAPIIPTTAAPAILPSAMQPNASSPISGMAALPFGISLADATAPQTLGAAQPSANLTRDALGFIELARPLETLIAPVASHTHPVTHGGGSTAPHTGTRSVESFGGLGSPTVPIRAADVSSIPFDVMAVRRDFPILQERVNGRPLVWLDNAATTQKPQAVIDRMKYYFEHENSNVHRAAHTLAARSTDAYEAAREKVARFLNATSSREVIFVRGATEGINLIAQTWGKRHIGKDDEILITHLEHHANIVPWQMLCAEKGAKLRVAPVDDTGQIILEEYEKLLSPRTKLVAFPHVSNALGTVTPVRQMVQIARRHGAIVVIDGAQGLSHMRVDMQEYDCDFYVFSGHKLFAPTGIGVVYGKAEILENLPPYQGGGNMIADVTFEKTVYNPPPIRFEAGTGSIADAVGLGAAIDYLDRLGMPNIARYEHDLLVYGTEVLTRIPGLRMIGTAKEKASVLSFVLEGYRTEDVGAALAREGIAVRSGHHCAQPILRRFGVESTVRPSLAFYNTCDEIDTLAAAIWNLKGGRTPSVV